MPFDVDTITLKAFVATAETLNFTRAAQRVGRSQSAVSLQIQRLEASLKQRLLERSQHHVRLTPSGEIFLGYARQILHLQAEAFARLGEPLTTGEIRLGTPEDFATHYLPDVLAQFRALHPQVQLIVNCDLTMNLLAGFQAGDYDIILVKRDPQATTGGLRVWREPLVWVASDSFVPEETLSLVLSPAPCIYRARVLAALDGARLPWRVAYTSPSLTGTLAAVKAGLGMSVLPAKMVPRGLRALYGEAGLPELPEAEIAMVARDDLSEAGRVLEQHITRSLELSAG